MKSKTPRIPKAKRISIQLGETPWTKRCKKSPLGDVIDRAIVTYDPSFFKYAPTKAAISRERARFISRAVRAIAEMVVRDGEMRCPMFVHTRVRFQHGRQ
jgi:hypothetical protein